jgi:hypothetical protein
MMPFPPKEPNPLDELYIGAWLYLDHPPECCGDEMEHVGHEAFECPACCCEVAADFGRVHEIRRCITHRDPG